MSSNESYGRGLPPFVLLHWLSLYSCPAAKRSPSVISYPRDWARAQNASIVCQQINIQCHNSPLLVIRGTAIPPFYVFQAIL